MKKLLFLLFILLQANISSAQLINIDSIRAHLSFLAHDSLEGRHAESDKADIAANYIRSKFKEIGLRHYKDLDTASNYFHEFAYPPHVFKNVIGVVESENPTYKHEFILIGAHYDHIGWIEADSGKIVFNGADDNASGVAAIIEIARQLQKNRSLLKRSVIIAAFDAEELGLYGSSAFAEDAGMSRIKAAVSVDMIGRYKTYNKLGIIGVSSFEGGVDFFNSIPKTKLNIDFEPYGFMWNDATDIKPFYDAGIPSLHIFTGLHQDYHQETDDVELINFNELTLAAEEVYNITLALSNKESIKFRKTKEFVRLRDEFIKVGLKFTYRENRHIYPNNFFDAKYAPGGGGGLFVNLSFNNYLHLQAEALYSYYGSRSPQNTFRVHSLDFPAHLMISAATESMRLFFMAGGYYNRPFNIDEIAKESGYDMSAPYDYGYSISWGMDVFNFQISVAFRESLISTVHNPFTGFGRNESVNLTFGIYILP